MSKENINWIFNLRIIATFAVIMLHVSSPIVVNYSNNSLSSWFVSNFFDSLSRFCVPVFVMISGALLLGKSEDIVVFLQKRVKRILVTFLFCFTFSKCKIISSLFSTSKFIIKGEIGIKLFLNDSS